MCAFVYCFVWVVLCLLLLGDERVVLEFLLMYFLFLFELVFSFLFCLMLYYMVELGS